MTPEFLELTQSCRAGFADGSWALARPLPYYGGFFRRCKLAFDVFRGRADALYWVKQ